ncbi:MAG: hypothetical protein LN413_07000 [Candidatus Thermoplasmatota archaeon]|nr:hypothetical protein [Candidatus Thermoplasmatota archaeon]
MPHAVFDFTALAADQRFGGRELVPGIAPGGSFAGREQKPALLLRDAWVEITDVVYAGGVSDYNGANFLLQLSQDVDLNPALQLPVDRFGNISMAATDTTAEAISPLNRDHQFKAQGTIWAPQFVGVRFDEKGAANFTGFLHLDYEMVMVPWMDWFIMWEFLDNIVDGARDY